MANGFSAAFLAPKRNLFYYRFGRPHGGYSFDVVADSYLAAVHTARAVAPGAVYLGMNGSLPGVHRHALQAFATCRNARCRAIHPAGQSCGCFDNGGE